MEPGLPPKPQTEKRKENDLTGADLEHKMDEWVKDWLEGNWRSRE